MSYDLMVFEKNTAPHTKSEFMKWYDEQTDWTEAHDYDDPAMTSPALREWFMEIIQTFPPMNGELSPSEEEIDKNEDLEFYLTDYSIGKDMIYAAFAWSLCEEAYDMTRKLALKHQVGFFDVSGEGDIILPDGSVLE